MRLRTLTAPIAVPLLVAATGCSLGLWLGMRVAIELAYAAKEPDRFDVLEG